MEMVIIATFIMVLMAGYAIKSLRQTNALLMKRIEILEEENRKNSNAITVASSDTRTCINTVKLAMDDLTAFYLDMTNHIKILQEHKDQVTEITQGLSALSEKLDTIIKLKSKKSFWDLVSETDKT